MVSVRVIASINMIYPKCSKGGFNLVFPVFVLIIVYSLKSKVGVDSLQN